MGAAAQKRVAIVGATGVAGQQFLTSLGKHPWFKVKRLAASERSAGKPYGEAIKDPSSGATRWFCDEPCPQEFLNIQVEQAEKLKLDDIDLVFTAIESDAAKVVEPLYAAKVPVFSTASAFRYEADVPVFLPGVNIEHAALVGVQQKKRGWKGFSPGPNCTTVGLVFSLKPLLDRFGINSVIMTSMQAVSGAGRSPGVLSYDILDNVIPYIPKEEEKVQIETQKVLGKLAQEAIVPAPFNVSCTCTRVNVIDGHTEAVFVSLREKATPEDVKRAWRESYKEFLGLGLPSAPPELVHYNEEPFRPQPRLDRNLNDGMTTVIGRLRTDNVLPNGIKYVLLSHNTKMGAAKGAVLTAEFLLKRGVVS
jgi:aspartate-semialdehyde dehydrogenase